MRVLINASTVKYGGGLSEVFNFLNAFKVKNKIYRLFLLAPRDVGFEQFEPFFQITYVPEILLKWRNRFFLDNKFTNNFIKKNKIEVILSFGNMPLPTKLRQIFLFNNPFFTSNDLKKIGYKGKDLREHLIRNFFIERRMKYVDFLLVQTRLQGEKLEKKYPTLSYRVIGNPPNVFDEIQEIKNFGFDDNKIKLLCFSRYYPHKNIEVLLEVAKLIKQKNKKYQIIVTLEKNQHKNVGKFLRQIKENNLGNQILNIGYVNRKYIKSLYKQMDALLLSTLMESFSTTYTDAMQYGIPILTSNLDFAKETCGEGALYFNPNNPKDIINVIENLFSNENLKTQKILKGREKLATYKNWYELVDDIAKLIKK